LEALQHFKCQNINNINRHIAMGASKPYPCSKRFNAKMPRRNVNTAKLDPGRLPFGSPNRDAQAGPHNPLQNPCAFAALRLCVKIPLHGYG
jgi:hypothetical protein